MKHYGLAIWIIISTVIILIIALVSSVCVLASDKVVKCPAKQYKWQYSIYGKAPSMPFESTRHHAKSSLPQPRLRASKTWAILPS